MVIRTMSSRAIGETRNCVLATLKCTMSLRCSSITAFVGSVGPSQHRPMGLAHFKADIIASSVVHQLLFVDGKINPNMRLWLRWSRDDCDIGFPLKITTTTIMLMLSRSPQTYIEMLPQRRSLYCRFMSLLLRRPMHGIWNGRQKWTKKRKKRREYDIIVYCRLLVFCVFEISYAFFSLVSCWHAHQCESYWRKHSVQ